jgi:hypothetical protein
MRRTPIPTLEESPTTPDGYMRALDDLLPLSLIPTDDAGLRSLVVKMFNLSEHDCNNGEGTPGGGKSFNDSYKQMLLDLWSTPARTPGSIAWKCWMVLNFFEDEETWEWWRYLLKSAVTDAIDLERARTDIEPPPAG